jgi:hypothetical protein
MKRYFIVSAIVGGSAMASFSAVFAAPLACEGNLQTMGDGVNKMKLSDADIKVVTDLQDSATERFSASGECRAEGILVDVTMSTLSPVSARSA